ncbi:PAS domain S-box protein [Noviherbaspirillum sedimenti]|uniref:Sensory/regulatory protein RpfC n=1 Tax=Noviherbaspirillum sedimenti TaxID=2320865 RepID=A0A3A3G6U3_9BURK|nr:PAS domain S-box protein [Noviherbaspirillum sedimenti]RJG02459.1 PAS domain-containing sensor histidine kinase [Noviherbaspirillum sedimenti]
MERIIHFGFLTTVSIIIGMSLLLYGALSRSHEASQQLYQINAILNGLQQVRDDYLRAELAVRKYTAAGNPADLAENAFFLKRIGADIAALKPLLADDAGQQRRLQQLASAFAKPNPALDASLPNRPADNIGAPLMQVRQDFFDVASDIGSETLRDFTAHGEAAQRRFHTTLVTLASMVAIGLMMLLAVYLNVIMQIRARKLAEMQQKESSEILRLTVDSVDGMIIYVDRDQRFKFHNKAYAQLFKDGSESIVGATVEQALGQDLYGKIKHWIDQVLAGQTVQGEYQRILPDGSRMDVRTSLVPHRDETGEVQGFFGQLTDITEYKRKEALLLATTTFQKAILDSARISIITVDREGNIQSFNVGAERMLGYRAEEVIGKINPLCFHDEREIRERAPALSLELGETVEPGLDVFIAKGKRSQVYEDEWTYVRKDGSRLPVFLSITALRTNADDIIGYLGIAFDITQQKETEAQLQQARADAEEASRAKSAFLATMSHEIRTPMNGVLGMAEVLARSKLTRHQSEMVQTIRDSAGVLLNLIDAILDFSKIEAGRLELERAPLSIRDLAEGICTSLLPVAAGKGVDLNLFVSPAIPERVMADDVRLRQMLYNLLGNAIKFSGDRPGQRGRVWLRAEVLQAAPLKIAFRISDNGIGMAPEAVDKLFSPFTQAEASTTRRFGGSGLGLAICKRLVELTQGEIRVDSTLGSGSSFTIILPFTLAEEQTAQALPDLNGISCIVIENPQIAAADLCAYLAPQGAQVHIAASLETAAAMAAGAAPPVVVVHDASSDQQAARQAVHAAFAATQDVRHLLLTRGSRRQGRAEAPGIVSLDADALPRGSFLHAVAVAAGRLALEMLHYSAGDQPATEVAPPGVTEARAQGRLILVAEDDAINQKVILRQLAVLGYAAEVAGTGVEALQLWRAGRYALLLTDLHMPELDGYELTKAIRAEESPEQHMPILALTANALRGETGLARAAGMDDYLTKPVQLKVLQRVLEKWMPAADMATIGATVAAPDNAAPEAAAVDVNVLKGLVGADDDAVRELLADYRAIARQQAVELRHELDAGNIGLVGAIAHKLKSSSQSVGALALAAVCAELERAGKAADKDAVLRNMPKFDVALGAADSALAGLLAEEPGTASRSKP